MKSPNFIVLRKITINNKLCYFNITQHDFALYCFFFWILFFFSYFELETSFEYVIYHLTGIKITDIKKSTACYILGFKNIWLSSTLWLVNFQIPITLNVVWLIQLQIQKQFYKFRVSVLLFDNKDAILNYKHQLLVGIVKQHIL